MKNSSALFRSQSSLRKEKPQLLSVEPPRLAGTLGQVEDHLSTVVQIRMDLGDGRV